MMIHNSDFHSTAQHAPVQRHPQPHLSSAGYLSPASPIGTFGLWGDTTEPMRPSAVGSFVSKAKSMLRGKRNSWQMTSNIDTTSGTLGIQRMQTMHQPPSRPPTQRQATVPLLSYQTTAGLFRPARKRNSSSIQISKPTDITSTINTPNPSLDLGQKFDPAAARKILARPSPKASASCCCIHIRNARSLNMANPSSILEQTKCHTKAMCDIHNVGMVTGYNQVTRLPYSVSGSTVTSSDKTRLTAGLEAEVVATFKEYEYNEGPTRPHAPFEYTMPSRTSSRSLEGLDLGASETMLAISEAGLLHNRDACVAEGEVAILLGALANMFAYIDDDGDGETQTLHGSNLGRPFRPCIDIGIHPMCSTADGSHDIIDECPDSGRVTPFFPLPTQRQDEFPPAHGLPMSKGISNTLNQIAKFSRRPITMRQLLKDMDTSLLEYLLTPQSHLQPQLGRDLPWFETKTLKGQQGVEIVTNDACAVELDVVVEAVVANTQLATTSESFRNEELANTGSGSRTLLTTSSSVRPAIPVRSAHRPIVKHELRGVPTSVSTPGPSTPDPLAFSGDSTAASEVENIPESHDTLARNARAMFVESQAAHVVEAPHAKELLRLSKHRRKSRSHSHISKTKSRPTKRVTGTIVDGLARVDDEGNEWIVVPSFSARSLLLSRRHSKSIRKSLYASPSLVSYTRSSRRSGIIRPSARVGMIKSPPIRSGLTSLASKHGSRASQSRKTSHSHYGMLSQGSRVNDRTPSRAYMSSSLPSTRSLPENPKGKLVAAATGCPQRPPRSHARPRPEHRLKSVDLSGKESLSAARDESSLPLGGPCTRPTTPFEAAVCNPNHSDLPSSRNTEVSDCRSSLSLCKRYSDEEDTLIAGVAGGNVPTRRSPPIIVPPRNPARVAMSSRAGNQI